MIKPLYNLIKRKKASPPALSPLQPIESAEEEGEQMVKAGVNKLVVVGAVVFTGILAVVMFGTRSKRSKRDEEEAFIKETARYEMEKKAYDEQRNDLLSEFQSLSSQRNELLKRLKTNFERARQNAEDFKEMFSEKKGEHAGGDEGDSINTAFMLKDELELKKKQMIDGAKFLGTEKQQLLQMIQENKENINRAADTYNGSFDGDPLPRVEEY